MSTSAIDLMNEQYRNFIEFSPSSQLFTLDPGGSAVPFYGIFDEYSESDNSDSGHVQQMSTTPRIMIYEVLSGMVRDAEVTDGTTTWHISKPDKDETGAPVIWLY